MANPTTNAGIDQTTTDGVPLLLTGQFTQGTLPIKEVIWTQVSGPNCVMINPTRAVNQVFSTSAGTYVFAFTAYDTVNASGTDTVSVTITHDTGPIYPTSTHLPNTYQVGREPIQ